MLEILFGFQSGWNGWFWAQSGGGGCGMTNGLRKPTGPHTAILCNPEICWSQGLMWHHCSLQQGPHQLNPPALAQDGTDPGAWCESVSSLSHSSPRIHPPQRKNWLKGTWANHVVKHTGTHEVQKKQLPSHSCHASGAHEPQEANKHHAQHPLAPDQIHAILGQPVVAPNINPGLCASRADAKFHGTQNFASHTTVTAHINTGNGHTMWEHEATTGQKEGGNSWRGPADSCGPAPPWGVPSSWPLGCILALSHRDTDPEQPQQQHVAHSSSPALWSCPSWLNMEQNMFTTVQPHSAGPPPILGPSSQPMDMATHRQLQQQMAPGKVAAWHLAGAAVNHSPLGTWPWDPPIAKAGPNRAQGWPTQVTSDIYLHVSTQVITVLPSPQEPPNSHVGQPAPRRRVTTKTAEITYHLGDVCTWPSWPHRESSSVF